MRYSHTFAVFLLLSLASALVATEKGPDPIFLPEEFHLRLSGTYGCIASFPYLMQISRSGTAWALQVKKGNRTWVGKVSRTQFRALWQKLLAAQPDSLKKEYGSLRSTADFRGELFLSYIYNDRGVRKYIKLTIGTLKDARMRSVLQALMALVGKQQRLPLDDS